MNDLISVIVPIYNVEDYLDRCINSIINQSYLNLQIILVNDGSKDSSGEICEKWAEKDKRIQVIHKENGGVSHSRNVGIDNSKGKYLTFIDSDDFVHKDYIKILYELIKEYDCDFSMCNFIEISKETQIGEEKSSGNIKVKYSKNILKKEDSINVYPWNKLYKREIFDKVKYPVGKINEDVQAILKILYYSEKIVTTDMVLYYYWKNEKSIMRSEYSWKRMDYLDVVYEAYEFFLNQGEELYAYLTLRDYLNVILLQYDLCRTNKQESKHMQRFLKEKYSESYKIVIKELDIGMIEKIKYYVYNFFPQLFIIISKSKRKNRIN